MKQLWRSLRQPSTRWSLGTLVLGGMVIGATGLVAFDVILHETAKDSFCLSCHELQVNIGYEYEGMSHAENALGVRATCDDCHVPEAFVPKMLRKIESAHEVYAHFTGKIDTPEKFEAHRMEMATRVWAKMNENDSRECRRCHQADEWDLAAQTERAREFHSGALSNGKTCIDCHKGIAHSLPEGIEPDEQLPGIDPNAEVAQR